MTWEFEVIATRDRRILSRIFQTLEYQMLEIHSFTAHTREEMVHIMFVVSSEQDKAYRIEAMLHRIENVCFVTASRQKQSTTPENAGLNAVRLTGGES